MTIETNFDIPLVAGLALREKQIQQHYRPIIAVHKWFARRPGSLFRALVLSEFGNAPLADLYFQQNNFRGRKVADPFMGGGTPLIEANRVGCDVTGLDINPMAAWIVREEIQHLDLNSYTEEALRLTSTLRSKLETLYLTDCPLYGDKDVPVKYFLWVKTLNCESCKKDYDLFPGYLLSKDSRHPANVLVCPKCGLLNEVVNRENPGTCSECQTLLKTQGPAKRGRCKCPHCGDSNAYPRADADPPQHRLFAIEYFNPHRKASHQGRFFKRPDAKDLAKVSEATALWQETKSRFVPHQEILPGDETDRLRRWGYRRYCQLFNERQLLGLEHSCRLIHKIADQRVQRALATNLSDLLRYQNMLCRYDTWALKSLDIFSVHGFPVGLIQCESNFLGITNGKNTHVGSGGWTNIVEKYSRAKSYCDAPFEVHKQGKKSIRIPIEGEWIGERTNGHSPRAVNIHCADARTRMIKPNSLDAVLTDPPYFGNVQYGELMDFCYVWLRQLAGQDSEGFEHSSTRTHGELTGNNTQSRGLDNFTEGLAAVYSQMAEALKPGAPLAFTFHHNKPEPYFAVGTAILDSGLACSASLPCFAEMGSSIHIHGTQSSIVDTIFVCRDKGSIEKRLLFESTEELAEIIVHDLAQLSRTGRDPTAGDTRCIMLGHLTRMAIWNLRDTWNRNLATAKKLKKVEQAVSQFGELESLLECIEAAELDTPPAGPLFFGLEPLRKACDAVAF